MRHGIPHCATSAATAENVSKAFEMIAREALAQKMGKKELDKIFVEIFEECECVETAHVSRSRSRSARRNAASAAAS